MGDGIGDGTLAQARDFIRREHARRATR